MKLRFTRRAALDIAEIADHISKENPAAAERVHDGIEIGLQLLAQFPKIGRKQSVPGVRKFVTPRIPYLVFYKVDFSTEEILVLTVRHPSRLRPYEDV